MRSLYSLLFAILIISPNALFAQTTYEILVSSRGTNSVKQYDINGNYLSDFVSNGSGGLATTEDILFHPDGTVLVSGFNNTTIKQYNGISGAYIGDFTTGYALSNPSKMSIGWDSLLYVTQWGATQNNVVRFDLQGNFVDEFTSNGAPNGIGHTWDSENNFYIALFGQSGNGTVHKYDTAGNSLGTFINSSVLQGPTDIWFDKNGDMLVEDWSSGTVLRYDSAGQFIGIFLSGMTNPEGITILPNGDMLIGDWGQDAVHRFDSLGGYIGYFTAGNGLTDPNNIAMREQQGVSVNEITSSTIDFIAFASPGTNSCIVRFELAKEEQIEIDVRDQKGSLILELASQWYSKGGQKINFQFPKDLRAGYYIISLKTSSSVSSKKILIDQ
ncbi:MAG: hypothetical protein HKN22_00065 [Bacteroidia bacterium]|nr:hypothetical protein [Bacteroidia bacterium]